MVARETQPDTYRCCRERWHVPLGGNSIIVTRRRMALWMATADRTGVFFLCLVERESAHVCLRMLVRILTLHSSWPFIAARARETASAQARLLSLRGGERRRGRVKIHWRKAIRRARARGVFMHASHDAFRATPLCMRLARSSHDLYYRARYATVSC